MVLSEIDNVGKVAPSEEPKAPISLAEFSEIHDLFITVDRPGELDAQTGEIIRQTDVVDAVEGLVSQIVTTVVKPNPSTVGTPAETTERQPLPQPKLART